MTLNLENAYTKFFRKNTKFPKFKSKKNPIQSFPIPQNYKIVNGNKIQLPRIGKIKIKLHRHFDGITKTATVSKTNTGKYYISICIDDKKDFIDTVNYSEETMIGIDLGIKDFAVLSNGEKFSNPKYLNKLLKKLSTAQRKLSKCKNEIRKLKFKYRVAKIYEKISNQRRDFLNKLTTKLISENQAIVIESLDIKSMLKYKNLSRNILDTGWSVFITMLKYKAKIYGKTILKIGQFQPSSKTCSVCGYINNSLTLSDRSWVCPICNSKLDRDLNAAINIKRFGLESLQNSGKCL